jgi:hypothetical protein
LDFGIWTLDPGAQPFLLLHPPVHRESRLRPFGGGDDRELHVARCVSGDVQSGHARTLEAVGLDRSLAVEATSEASRQVGAVRLSGREEERGARETFSVAEPDPESRPVRLEADDRLLDDSDSPLFEPGRSLAGSRAGPLLSRTTSGLQVVSERARPTPERPRP